MARRFQPRLPILSGLLASVLFHAAVLIPLLVMALTPATLSRMPARFDPEDFTPRDEEKQPPLEDPELGIDRDTPSSLTWVGYEEYEEHLAHLAEVEQAAFTTSPPAGGAPRQPQAAQVTGGAESSQQTAPKQADASEQAGSPLSEDDLVAIRKFIDAAQVTKKQDDPADAEGAKAETASPSSKVDAPQRPQEVTKKAEAAPPAPSPAPASEPAPAEAETDGEEPEAEERPGEASEKESDATSVIDIPLDDLKLGKPIARPGLELKPRRPKFTTLMKVSASPCNPIVQISFDRDGLPVAGGTKILKTSCDRRVDHAIENSLFRWRAAGKQLEELGEDETKTVQLKIILNPRAK